LQLEIPASRQYPFAHKKGPASRPDLFVKIHNLVVGMVMVMMATVMMVLGVRRNNRPNQNHKGDGGKE
jgi:hypothetical protein